MESLDLTRRLQKRILLVCLLTVPVWGVVVLLLRLPEEERLSAFLCVPALVLLMGLTLLGLTVLCGHVLLTAEGIVVETVVDPILYGRLKEYITKEC